MNETSGAAADPEFERYLRELAGGIADGAGFCAPDSVLWRVNREPALLLVGMRALLMQIAHPKVAQGVADHSRYREDPLGRGIRTFTAMYSMLFGARDEALAAARRVRTVHNRVHGRVTDPLPAGMSPDYDANDPELLFWVAATLLDSAILAYERFVAPLDDAEKDRFLREAQAIGALFGIPAARYPDSWLDFKRWMAQQLAGATLTVTPTARAVLGNLLAGTWLTRVLASFNHAIAAMLLPAPLAVRFGLKRRFRDRLLFQAMGFGARVLARLVPWSWRGVPAARRRER
jgi:uncharacterized protein (DUF2236 family)